MAFCGTLVLFQGGYLQATFQKLLWWPPPKNKIFPTAFWDPTTPTCDSPRLWISQGTVLLMPMLPAVIHPRHHHEQHVTMTAKVEMQVWEEFGGR